MRSDHSSSQTEPRPLQLALVTNALGLGGTEKGLVNHALAFDRQVVVPRVVTVLRGGPRREALELAGIEVEDAAGDPGRLVSLLRGADIVHVFRGGGPEPAVPSAVRKAGVPLLVESNIFGHVDATPDERDFACHLFISRMCAERYRAQVGAGPEFHQRHRVSPLPIDAARLEAMAPDRREARRTLGLDLERPVVGRIGRRDDHKWRDILVDMLPRLFDLVPDVQVLFVGTSEEKERRLKRRGLLERVRLAPETADEERLATLYAACDVIVHASSIGESQGVVIAEAMALGKPVVTCPTPWVDNAQIELVDEGRTGHVAGHPRQFADAVAALLMDEDRRGRFGAAARRKAELEWDRDRLTRRLELLYGSLHRGEGLPVHWEPSPSEMDAFAADYAIRLRNEFRALTPLERLQRAGRDLRERGRWTLRAGRASLASLVRQRRA